MDKQKIPAAIIIFLIWIGWSFLSTLFAFRINKSYIGPFFFEGIGSIIFTTIFLIIYGLVFYGTIKRNSWARKLTLIYYPISVLIILVNLVTFFVNKDLIISFLSEIKDISAATSVIPIESVVLSGLIFGLIFQFVITVLIVVLMVKKKDYFVHPIVEKYNRTSLQ